MAITSDPSEERAMPASSQFEDVFIQFFPRLRGFFRSHGFSASDAEDLSQTTLWNVYQAWGQYRGEGSLDSWIYAAGRNVAVDAIRRRARRREDAGVPESVRDPAPAPEERAARQEEAGRTAAALTRLPVRMRACLLLRFQKELSYREISRRLGISEATVKVQIWMARRRLREALKAS